MDTRQALLSGTILDLPGMHCMIQKEIGRGANAIVYQASYPDLLHPDETHTVLVKELFPFHPERAIYRAEDGFRAAPSRTAAPIAAARTYTSLA